MNFKRTSDLPVVRSSGGGDAAYDLIVEVLALFFRLQALGRRGGAVSPWGGGVWGLLRTLAVEGPKTVPEIAQMRPVSRQHVQKLADELAEEGFVEFVANPRHKRSNLVRLTRKGRAHFETLDQTVREAARAATAAQDLGDLETTVETLRATLRALPNIDN